MGGLAQNVQKPPPGKNVQKSQGQIFQECVECQECQGQIFQECVEGQISQGQIFQGNPKVKCQGQECQECVEGQKFPRSNGSNVKEKFPKKNRKKPEKWESVTKIKKTINT